MWDAPKRSYDTDRRGAGGGHHREAGGQVQEVVHDNFNTHRIYTSEQ